MSFVRSSLFFAITAALVFQFPSMAAADTIVNKQISYFSITGTTAEELDRALIAKGPLTGQTGLRHPGITRIRFGGHVTYIEKENRCYVSKARVTLSTHLILPRWTNRKNAGANLKLIWDTLSADIKRHEERHAEIARTHARSMEQAFLALPPQESCKAMQTLVADTSSAAIEAHDRDQARFDRIEGINFEARLVRLLKYKLQAQQKSN